MSNQYVLTPTEKKIRKQWLVLMLFLLATSFLLYFFNLLALGFPTLSENPFAYLNFISLFPFIWLYVCGYRAHGTKLLTFIFVMFPLGFIKEIELSLQSLDFDLIIGVLAFAPFKIWYYVKNIQLRRMNFRLKEIKHTTRAMTEEPAYMK